MSLQEGQNNCFCCSYLVYRFPDDSISDKSIWSSTLEVKCGWGQAWDPPTVVGCVDPRGCKDPPKRTAEVWGSFEDSPTKSLDVGTSYWYSCRAGLFLMGKDNYSSFIDLKCINDPSGGPPIWDPPFDNFINPFPDCVNIRELILILLFITSDNAGVDCTLCIPEKNLSKTE